MAVGHALFLCGGVSIDRSSSDPELTSVADVDEYDVTTDTWVLKTCLLKERHDACCVKSGMYIYIKINVKIFTSLVKQSPSSDNILIIRSAYNYSKIDVYGSSI